MQATDTVQRLDNMSLCDCSRVSATLMQLLTSHCLLTRDSARDAFIVQHGRCYA